MLYWYQHKWSDHLELYDHLQNEAVSALDEKEKAS